MPSESMTAALVRYGFPLFWVGVGVVQWFWPAAIFAGVSHENATPGARLFVVLWLTVGATLGLLFVPVLAPFDGWFVPGFVLAVLGGLQWIRPAWSVSVGGLALDERQVALGCSVGGLAVLVLGLL